MLNRRQEGARLFLVLMWVHFQGFILTVVNRPRSPTAWIGFPALMRDPGQDTELLGTSISSCVYEDNKSTCFEGGGRSNEFISAKGFGTSCMSYRHYHPSATQFKVQLKFGTSRRYPADFTRLTADACFLSPSAVSLIHGNSTNSHHF